MKHLLWNKLIPIQLLFVLISLTDTGTTSATTINPKTEALPSLLTWDQFDKDVFWTIGDFSFVQDRSFLFGVTLQSLAAFDAYNSVMPSYNPYAFVLDRNIEGNPQVVAEVAALTAAEEWAQLFSKSYLEVISPDEKTRLMNKMQASAQNYESKMAAYGMDPNVNEGKEIGHRVALIYMQLRWLDGSSSSDFFHRTGKGQYQVVGNPESIYIAPLGTKPYVLCNLDEGRFGLLDQLPDLSSRNYLKDYNETRCLGRALGSDGNPVVGPGCIRSNSNQELETANLALDPEQPLVEILKRLDLSLSEYLRFQAEHWLILMEGYRISWEIRKEVNHWRPWTAIHSGLLESDQAMAPREEDWMPRSGQPVNFPEYPSGTVHGLGVEYAWFGQYLNEFPEHQNQGMNVRLVKGKRFYWNIPYKYSIQGIEMSGRRSFNHFVDFIKTWGEARILSGDHFRTAVTDGMESGIKLGYFLYEKSPLKRLNPDSKEPLKPFVDLDGNILSCNR